VLVLPVIRFWRRLTARHTKLYSWAALSLAMVAVILITSLGARPDVTQLLFLALVGVVVSGAVVLLLNWEHGGERARMDDRD
jgi:hypothetical protein